MRRCVRRASLGDCGEDLLVVVQADRRTGVGVGCHGDETW